MNNVHPCVRVCVCHVFETNFVLFIGWLELGLLVFKYRNLNRGIYLWLRKFQDYLQYKMFFQMSWSWINVLLTIICRDLKGLELVFRDLKGPALLFNNFLAGSRLVLGSFFFYLKKKRSSGFDRFFFNLKIMVKVLISFFQRDKKV